MTFSLSAWVIPNPVQMGYLRLQGNSLIGRYSLLDFFYSMTLICDGNG